MTFFCVAADTIAVKALDWSVPQACREAAGCPFDVVGALQQNDPLLCVGAEAAVPKADVPPLEDCDSADPVDGVGGAVELAAAPPV